MKGDWQQRISCATKCQRCNRELSPKDQRILSVYDHEAICMACKNAEEKQSDYEAVSKRTIGECMAETELNMNDPEGYCFHHFYPYKC